MTVDGKFDYSECRATSSYWKFSCDSTITMLPTKFSFWRYYSIILICWLGVNDAIPYGAHTHGKRAYANASWQPRSSASSKNSGSVTERFETIDGPPTLVTDSSDTLLRGSTDVNSNININIREESIFSPVRTGTSTGDPPVIEAHSETPDKNECTQSKNSAINPNDKTADCLREDENGLRTTKDEIVPQKCPVSTRRSSEVSGQSSPGDEPSVNVAGAFVVGGEAEAKKTSNVYTGEGITVCWIELTTIREDTVSNPPKKLVIREFAISFENSDTILEKDMDCSRIRGEMSPGDEKTVCQSSLDEMVVDDTKRSRVVEFAKDSQAGSISIRQYKKVKCGMGSVVSKTIYEWPDGTDNPKKRVEIKVAPSVQNVRSGEDGEPSRCAPEAAVEDSQGEVTSTSSSECPSGASCETSIVCEDTAACNETTTSTSCEDGTCASTSLPEESLSTSHSLEPEESVSTSHSLEPEESVSTSHPLESEESLSTSHPLESEESLSTSPSPEPEESLLTSHPLESEESLSTSHSPESEESLSTSHPLESEESLSTSPSPEPEESLSTSHPLESEESLSTSHSPESEESLSTSPSPEPEESLSTSHPLESEESLSSSHSPESEESLSTSHPLESEESLSTSPSPEPEESLLTSHPLESEESLSTSHSPESEESLSTSHSPEPEESLSTSHSPESKESLSTSHSPESEESLSTSHPLEPEGSPSTSNSLEPEESLSTSHSPEPEESLSTSHPLESEESLSTSHPLESEESLSTSPSPEPEESLSTSHPLESEESLSTSHSPESEESLSTSHPLESKESLSTSPSPEPEESLSTSNSPESQESLSTSNPLESEESLSTSHSPEPEESPSTSNSLEPEESLSTSNSSESQESLSTSHSPEPEESLSTSHSSEPEESLSTSHPLESEESLSTSHSLQPQQATPNRPKKAGSHSKLPKGFLPDSEKEIGKSCAEGDCATDSVDDLEGVEDCSQANCTTGSSNDTKSAMNCTHEDCTAESSDETHSDVVDDSASLCKNGNCTSEEDSTTSQEGNTVTEENEECQDGSETCKCSGSSCSSDAIEKPNSLSAEDKVTEETATLSGEELARNDTACDSESQECSTSSISSSDQEDTTDDLLSTSDNNVMTEEAHSVVSGMSSEGTNGADESVSTTGTASTKIPLGSVGPVCEDATSQDCATVGPTPLEGTEQLTLETTEYSATTENTMPLGTTEGNPRIPEAESSETESSGAESGETEEPPCKPDSTGKNCETTGSLDPTISQVVEVPSTLPSESANASHPTSSHELENNGDPVDSPFTPIPMTTTESEISMIQDSTEVPDNVTVSNKETSINEDSSIETTTEALEKLALTTESCDPSGDCDSTTGTLSSTEPGESASIDSTTSTESCENNNCNSTSEPYVNASSTTSCEDCDDGSSSENCGTNESSEQIGSEELVDNTTREPTATINNVSETTETRRTTVASALPQKPEVKHKLKLRIKVLLEHINEKEEKEKIVQLEKHLLLDEMLDQHGNHSLIGHLKSLNKSMNIETFKTIFHLTDWDNLTEIFSHLTEYNNGGSKRVPTLKTQDDSESKSNETSSRAKRDISKVDKTVEKEKNSTDSAKAKAIRESLPGVNEDFQKGLGHVLGALSHKLNGGAPKAANKSAESSTPTIMKILADPADKRIHSRRQKRATNGKDVSIDEMKHPVDGKDIGRWSNERFVMAGDGGRVRSLLEFEIMRDPSDDLRRIHLGS